MLAALLLCVLLFTSPCWCLEDLAYQAIASSNGCSTSYASQCEFIGPEYMNDGLLTSKFISGSSLPVEARINFFGPAVLSNVSITFEGVYYPTAFAVVWFDQTGAEKLYCDHTTAATLPSTSNPLVCKTPASNLVLTSGVLLRITTFFSVTSVWIRDFVCLGEPIQFVATSPEPFSTYVPGSAVPVTWSKSVYPGLPSVQLVLYRGSERLFLVTGAMNIQLESYSFTLPPSMAAGSNYYFQFEYQYRNTSIISISNTFTVLQTVRLQVRTDLCTASYVSATGAVVSAASAAAMVDQGESTYGSFPKDVQLRTSNPATLVVELEVPYSISGLEILWWSNPSYPKNMALTYTVDFSMVSSFDTNLSSSTLLSTVTYSAGSTQINRRDTFLIRGRSRIATKFVRFNLQTIQSGGYYCIREIRVFGEHPTAFMAPTASSSWRAPFQLSFVAADAHQRNYLSAEGSISQSGGRRLMQKLGTPVPLVFSPVPLVFSPVPVFTPVPTPTPLFSPVPLIAPVPKYIAPTPVPLYIAPTPVPIRVLPTPVPTPVPLSSILFDPGFTSLPISPTPLSPTPLSPTPIKQTTTVGVYKDPSGSLTSVVAVSSVTLPEQQRINILESYITGQTVAWTLAAAFANSLVRLELWCNFAVDPITKVLTEGVPTFVQMLVIKHPIQQNVVDISPLLNPNLVSGADYHVRIIDEAVPSLFTVYTDNFTIRGACLAVPPATVQWSYPTPSSIMVKFAPLNKLCRLPSDTIGPLVITLCPKGWRSASNECDEFTTRNLEFEMKDMRLQPLQPFSYFDVYVQVLSDWGLSAETGFEVRTDFAVPVAPYLDTYKTSVTATTLSLVWNLMPVSILQPTIFAFRVVVKNVNLEVVWDSKGIKAADFDDSNCKDYPAVLTNPLLQAKYLSGMQVVVPGLVHATRYFVTLYSFTCDLVTGKGKMSLPSSPFTVATAGLVPLPVSSLISKVTEDNTVKIQFVVPAGQGSDCTSFDIRLMKLPPTDTVCSVSTLTTGRSAPGYDRTISLPVPMRNSTEPPFVVSEWSVGDISSWVVFDGLTQGSAYCFAVLAHNAVGASPWSEMKQEKTHAPLLKLIPNNTRTAFFNNPVYAGGVAADVLQISNRGEQVLHFLLVIDEQIKPPFLVVVPPAFPMRTNYPPSFERGGTSTPATAGINGTVSAGVGKQPEVRVIGILPPGSETVSFAVQLHTEGSGAGNYARGIRVYSNMHAIPNADGDALLATMEGLTYKEILQFDLRSLPFQTMLPMQATVNSCGEFAYLNALGNGCSCQAGYFFTTTSYKSKFGVLDGTGATFSAINDTAVANGKVLGQIFNCGPCSAGTYRPTETPSDVCMSCPDGYFSEAASKSCTKCPSSGVTCLAGLLKVKNNYWYDNALSPNITANTAFFKCLSDQSCTRVSDTEIKCRTGYTGPLCAICDDGYTKSSSTNCSKCMGSTLNGVLVSVFLIVFFLIVLWRMFYRKGTAARSPTKVILRIFINYLQMISILGAFKAKSTDLFREMVGFAESANGPSFSFTPLGCAMDWDFKTRWWAFVTIPLFIVLLPLAMIKANVVFQAIFRGAQLAGLTANEKISAKAAIKHLAHMRYMRTIVFLFVLMYQTISLNVMSIIPCEEVNGKRYLRADFSIDCDLAEVSLMRWVGILLFFLYCLGIPMFLFRCLYNHRDELDKESTFATFGFLYDGYKRHDSTKQAKWQNLYWWECFMVVRKLFMVAAAAFVIDPYAQIVIALSIIVVSLGLQAWLRPFQARMLNLVEAVSLVSIYIIQVLSVVYLRALEDALPDESDVSSSIYVSAACATVAFGTVLTFLYLLGKSYLDHRKAGLTDKKPLVSDVEKTSPVKHGRGSRMRETMGNDDVAMDNMSPVDEEADDDDEEADNDSDVMPPPPQSQHH